MKPTTILKGVLGLNQKERLNLVPLVKLGQSRLTKKSLLMGILILKAENV